MGEVAQKLGFRGTFWPRAASLQGDTSEGAGTAMAGGLHGASVELQEVERKAQSLWETVYGSDAVWSGSGRSQRHAGHCASMG